MINVINNNTNVLGKCDEIMKKVMSILNLDIPKYQRCLDPIFHHSTMLVAAEEHTTVHPVLAVPNDDTQNNDSKVVVNSEKVDEIKLNVSNCKNNAKMCSESKDLNQPTDLSPVKLENITSMIDQNELLSSPSCSSMDSVPNMNNFLKPFIEGLEQNSLEKSNVLSLVEPIVPYLNPFFMNNMETLGLSPTPVDQFYKNFVYQACIGLAAVEKFQIENKLTNKLSRKKKDTSEDKDDTKKTDVSNTRYCTFCHPVYGSTKCLFYHPYESKFKENVEVCLCCNDDTDEEDEDELKTDDIADKNDETEDKNDEVIEKAKVTAGWFGKGYKKRIKKKK